jgi:hypothetical protein
MDEVNEGFRTLCNEELCDVYRSLVLLGLGWACGVKRSWKVPIWRTEDGG